MIRLALPKGRNLIAVRAAMAAAGYSLAALDGDGRQLKVVLPEAGLELLLLKDWDLPLYVESGIADAGFVGSDVLEEVDGDLLVPLRLSIGGCRMSLIGRPGAAPLPGSQVRLATKYRNTAQRWLESQPWGAEVVPLSGSIELAPLLALAEVAVDIVQTGRTLSENGLVELALVAPVAPCLILNRASFQRRRAELNPFLDRLERASLALKGAP